MKKFLLVTVVLFAVVFALTSVTNSYHQAQAIDQMPADVSAKLDQVLNNQRSIMQALDSMKQELNIIKIRITQRQ